jgi:catechol 2,3-dioxygenase-like lactoylglutathione lyase family enzyme
MTATALDHVGVAVPDLDAAAAEWTALGFTVQPLAPHRSDGKPTGTGNRNIMLAEGYIELLATIDRARPSATIARFLAHHTGIHVLTLAMPDEDETAARLARAGFAPAIARSSRPADPAHPTGPQAEFARIPLPDADPRLQLLRHLTPDLVWQERFLTHPNGARALREVIVAADAAFAARLARAAGLPLRPDPEGGLALHLPGAAIRILPPDAARRVLPGADIPALPAIIGLTIETEDPAAIARRLGQPPGIPLLARASGVTIRFTP